MIERPVPTGCCRALQVLTCAYLVTCFRSKIPTAKARSRNSCSFPIPVIGFIHRTSIPARSSTYECLEAQEQLLWTGHPSGYGGGYRKKWLTKDPWNAHSNWSP